MRPTWVEINLGHVGHNIREIRSRIGDRVRIMVVAKANGYGHGAIQVARTALENGAQWIGVALVEEAVELRRNGIQSPILVLGPSSPTEAKDIVKYRLAQAVCTKELAQALSIQARMLGQAAKIHMKVDTGLGRLGIRVKEIFPFAEEISRLEGVEIEGIFTHFSVADEDKTFTELQIKEFQEVLIILEKAGIKPPLKHAANSAAVLDFPSSYFNMVRPGIMVYGLYPSPKVACSIPLKPVMSFKTQVAYLKTVPGGTGLSYGRTFITGRPSRIATLPVGYADGYPRALSNKAEVLVKGIRAPVVGRVCMDMTLIDVTHISGVKVGDEVVLFGSQDGVQLSVDEIASRLETINYELVSNISTRVPRIYLKEGRS